MIKIKTLIIAEKPSVAKEIASVVGRFDRKEGYLENGEYIVSWAYGHLVGLSQPHEYLPDLVKWTLESLPIIPEEFKLSVIGKKQFSILKKLLSGRDISVVVNGCDAGREGELIFRWIYRAAKSRIPIKRLWLSETTPKAIREAINNLNNGTSYEKLYAAAEARAKADWLVGINATRAYTVRHGEKLTIGRVQTPTLALIVQREREIRSFKSVPYWQVQATFKIDSGEKYQGLGYPDKETNRFTDKGTAKDYAARVTKTGTVEKVQYTEKTESPPTLFNLNDLQREANRLLGMTAAKVLEIAQSLYEKKLITYPRTDSRHLTKNLADALEKRIEAAMKQVFINNFPSTIPSLSKRFVDDSKVSDHHAIITTEIVAQDNLTDIEKKVYDLVCRRFLSMFLPSYKYMVMEVTTSAGEKFLSKGKSVISLGWRELYNFKSDEDKENEDGEKLPHLVDGQGVKVANVEVLEKETKPPTRYTDATLLSAMENAGRFVDDKELASTLKRTGGIGTPATRAAILERLITVNYVKRQKKLLAPTEKGEILIDLVPDKMKDVKTTAQWEDGLIQIEQDEIKPDEWLSGIVNITKEIVGIAKGQEKNDAVSKREVLGKCPLCGKDVVETKKGYGCIGWKEGCKFIIWKEIAQKKISVTQAKTLLSKKKTGVIKGFKSSRSDKKFDAALIMEQDGKISFKFENRNSKK